MRRVAERRGSRIERKWYRYQVNIYFLDLRHRFRLSHPAKASGGERGGGRGIGTTCLGRGDLACLGRSAGMRANRARGAPLLGRGEADHATYHSRAPRLSGEPFRICAFSTAMAYARASPGTTGGPPYRGRGMVSAELPRIGAAAGSGSVRNCGPFGAVGLGVPILNSPPWDDVRAICAVRHRFPDIASDWHRPRPR